MRPINAARPRSDDGGLVLAELRHSAELVRLACDVLDARLAAEAGKLAHAPKEVRDDLSTRLRSVIAEHKRLWLQRNRAGGLSDSIARMDALLNILR